MTRPNHWHVASGIIGYGPDGTDGYATFDYLGHALIYAHEELGVYIDMAHESAHAHAATHDYADAWSEIERMESLETLRANLSPERAGAPLYVSPGGTERYADLLTSQAAAFPHVVSHNAALYLWQCAEPDCEHDEN